MTPSLYDESVCQPCLTYAETVFNKDPGTERHNRCRRAIRTRWKPYASTLHMRKSTIHLICVFGRMTSRILSLMIEIYADTFDARYINS
jgi:hypothetical protein